MPDPLRWGSTPLIADTTVWSKLHLAPRDVQDDFRAAAMQGLIVVTPVVQLEFLHHALNGTEFDEYDARLAAAPVLPLTIAIGDRAVAALRLLRAKSAGGLHKVKAADALIAATAEANRVNVLHDDRHFDRLATVLAFESVRFGPYSSKANQTRLQRLSRSLIRRLPKAYR